MSETSLSKPRKRGKKKKALTRNTKAQLVPEFATVCDRKHSQYTSLEKLECTERTHTGHGPSCYHYGESFVGFGLQTDVESEKKSSQLHQRRTAPNFFPTQILYRYTFASLRAVPTLSFDCRACERQRPGLRSETFPSSLWTLPPEAPQRSELRGEYSERLTAAGSVFH